MLVRTNTTTHDPFRHPFGGGYVRVVTLVGRIVISNRDQNAGSELIPGTTFAILTTLFVVAAVPFAPTEAVLISASALAAGGTLSFPLVLVVGALGCATSDLVNYGIGRSIGPFAVTRARRRKATAAVLDWVSDRIHTRPVLILVAARFLPMGGILAAALCGTTRFPMRKFLPISLLGAGMWTVYAALLGYLGTSITGRPLLGIGVGLGLAMLLAAVSGLIGKRLPRRNVARTLETSAS